MSNYYDDATVGGWSLDGTEWNAMADDIQEAKNYVAALTVSTTQLNYCNTLSSNVQTQLNAKASLTGTETLTNKTLGTNTRVSVGSDSTGDLYYRNSSGVLTRLPIGSANKVLTSTGTGPTWLDAATVSVKYPIDYIVYQVSGTTYGMDLSDGSTIASGSVADSVIQAVIDDSESTGKKRIHIKEGTYTITNTLEVNSHIYLSGEGPEATKLRAGNSLNADIMQINSAQSSSQYRPIIDGIKFDGNNTNQTDGNCLTLYGAIEARIQNCHFEYFYDYGIYSVGTTGPTSGVFGHNNVFFNCLFDQSYLSSGVGIGLFQQWNDENHVTNCKFQYNKWGIHDKQGLMDIHGCDFVNAGGGIWMEDCSRNTITSCKFDRLPDDGILCKASFNIISNNIFFSIGEGSSGNKSGIQLQWYGANTITNNMFIAHDGGDSRSGIREAYGGDDTESYNIITNNQFLEASTDTSLGGTGWAVADIEEATANNVKANNVSR